MVEAMAGAGFDWMVIDTEHTPVEVSTVMGLLQAAAPYPTACVVRPVANDTALIKRHLDQGAQTLLLPYVESAAEAEAAVRYPTRGIRGVAGVHRSSRYGRVKGYWDKTDDGICLILQIETLRGLERLEEIAGVEGVDAIFIGPSDLAASMGYRSDPGHEGGAQGHLRRHCPAEGHRQTGRHPDPERGFRARVHCRRDRLHGGRGRRSPSGARGRRGGAPLRGGRGQGLSNTWSFEVSAWKQGQRPTLGGRIHGTRSVPLLFRCDGCAV